VENPQAGAGPIPHEIIAQDIAAVGDVIPRMRVETQAEATLDAHTRLASLLLHQGKIVTPDGKIQLIRNQKQAESLAQRLINEEISRQDAKPKRLQKAFQPPQGFTVEPKNAEVTAGGEVPAKTFKVGDRIILPGG
jgi:hypothetical protein